MRAGLFRAAEISDTPCFQPPVSAGWLERQCAAEETRELLQPGVGRGRAATAAHAAPGRREACEPCACTDRGEDDDLVSGNQRPERCVRGGRPATLGQGVDGLLRGAISLSVRAGGLVEHRGPWDVQHGAWRVPSRRSRIAATRDFLAGSVSGQTRSRCPAEGSLRGCPSESGVALNRSAFRRAP